MSYNLDRHAEYDHRCTLTVGDNRETDDRRNDSELTGGTQNGKR